MGIRDVIGERVRAAREAAGKSQGQLHRETGIARETITRIEQGGPGASIENLIAIADALGIRVSLLVDLSEDEDVTVDASTSEIHRMLEGASDIQLAMIRDLVTVIRQHTD